MTHIGPGNLKPGNFGYEFDLSLADCEVVMHGNGPRDPGAAIEIIPPDGKRVGLNIVGAIMAAEDMLAALKALTDADCTYSGNTIVITCASHSDAIRRMMEARASVQKAERHGS